MKITVPVKIFLISLFGMFSSTAAAHHPNAYRTPDSLTEGLLSGLGHPVIDVEHLLFILGIGLLAYLVRRPLLLPLLFIASTLLGTFIHLQAVLIPMSEVLVASSILLLGAMLISNWHKQVAALGLALGGVLHGYAYAESIIGAEITPLAAYLGGFALIQLGLCAAMIYLCHQLAKLENLPLVQVTRAYGVLALCGGSYFLG